METGGGNGGQKLPGKQQTSNDDDDDDDDDDDLSLIYITVQGIIYIYIWGCVKVFFLSWATSTSSIFFQNASSLLFPRISVRSFSFVHSLSFLFVWIPSHAIRFDSFRLHCIARCVCWGCFHFFFVVDGMAMRILAMFVHMHTHAHQLILTPMAMLYASSPSTLGFWTTMSGFESCRSSSGNLSCMPMFMCEDGDESVSKELGWR